MNVCICDDCAAHIAHCKDALKNASERLGVSLLTREYSSGDAFLFAAEDLLSSIDIVYLDIHMPGTDGLETAKQLRALGYGGDIVFFTVSADYAVDGYDVSALHYIVKNATSDQKFGEIFSRACERKKRRESELLVLTCAGESRCIPLDSIRYFEITQRIVTVYYDDERFEFYSTISRMEEQLFSKGFLRTHKSFLVNKRYLRSVDSSRVLLDDGKELPVGKRYYSENLKNLGAV